MTFSIGSQCEPSSTCWLFVINLLLFICFPSIFFFRLDMITFNEHNSVNGKIVNKVMLMKVVALTDSCLCELVNFQEIFHSYRKPIYIRLWLIFSTLKYLSEGFTMITFMMTKSDRWSCCLRLVQKQPKRVIKSANESSVIDSINAISL